MAICSRCNCEFDISDARDSIDAEFGDGIYDNTYHNGRFYCENCAFAEISADFATGQELQELMGSSWDDD